MSCPMIEIILKDDIETRTLPVLELSLSEETIENATDVKTLDFNVYTDFINQKREWSHTWSFLSKGDYDTIRGFYDRQFTAHKYPTLTILFYGITDVPVRILMGSKNTMSNAGMVKDVNVKFRETVQL